ncbi:MAG: CoA pyrophosphatase [Firmicutes bacterium]|nr:CoA pyrophosphatase [Bacillota bacterium]
MMELETIRTKMEGRKPGVIGDKKEFAVLIPLVEKDGELHFLFEKRAEGIRQPGDVCFPGGKIEPGENIIECVLRETAEEIGITDVEVLGQFDSILEVNRITMHTVVGIVSESSIENAVINTAEVAEIFTVPVRFFIENEPVVYTGKIVQDTTDFPYEENGIRSDYKWRVGKQDIYIYHYGDKVIWGLTARVFRWFIEKMKEE